MVIEKEPKPENILESRDALQIQGAEKDEPVIQTINQLIILGVTKPENGFEQIDEI